MTEQNNLKINFQIVQKPTFVISYTDLSNRRTTFPAWILWHITHYYIHKLEKLKLSQSDSLEAQSKFLNNIQTSRKSNLIGLLFYLIYQIPPEAPHEL